MPVRFFLTQALTSPPMYRSLVMMLSPSSSNACSHPLIAASRRSCTSVLNRKPSRTLLSRSNSLTAYHRAASAGTAPAMIPVISERACSTCFPKVCCGLVPPFACAICTARSAACREPSPLIAEVSITSQPSISESFWVSIRSPFLRTISIMFSAITTGIPISVSWVVR